MALLLKCIITFCFLSTYVSPIYAIPPPETLALLGGSLIYPGFLIFGVLSLIVRYVWVKTKLFLWYRLHFTKIICFILLFSVHVPNHWFIQNDPVTLKTIKEWQHSDAKPIFIDVRDKKSYNTVHLLGSLFFPLGRGLLTYLKMNKDKHMILYCNFGASSSTLFGLEGQSLLKQALAEKRLFYLPGGIHQLVTLGQDINIPYVSSIPENYAKFLLEKPRFTEIQIADNSPSTQTQLRQAYEKAIAAHHIPIINTKLAYDSVAQMLEPLNISHVFFTTTHPSEPYPFHRLLWVVFFSFSAFFALRLREFFQSIFATPSTLYPWIYMFFSMMMSILILPLELSHFFIPFDFELHELNADFPMQIQYLCAVYALFGFVVWMHLLYPDRKRLNIHILRLRQFFVPLPPTQTFHFPKMRDLGIVIGAVSVVHLFKISLPSLVILSLFLMIPLCVDLVLYSLICRFKYTPEQTITLLKRCGYGCCPGKEAFIQLNTHHDREIGKIHLIIGNQSASLGLFTGQIVSDSGDLFLQNVQIEESTLMDYSHLIRSLLLFFQQDFLLQLDHDGNIISLNLVHNHQEASVVNRHLLLKHHQTFPGKPSEKRFSSVSFQEVFSKPTPLMVDLLQCRWGKKGGYYQSLYKLGLLLKSDEKTKEQCFALSHHLYLDKSFEKEIFSERRWLSQIRKKIVDMRFHLAIESLFEDYHTIILPRTELRLAKLSESIDKPLSFYQLKRVINKALRALYQESGMWQSYSSLLNQHAFQTLQMATVQSSADLAHFIQAPPHSWHTLPLPSYYEFSENISDFKCIHPKNELKETHQLSDEQHVFLKTELIRTNLRQLQLKEWQLISLLLEKCQNKLNLPIPLAYLTIDDFLHLPADRMKLLSLLQHRYDDWLIQNKIPFPDSFSFEDLESASSTSRNEKEEEKIIPEAIRVAGNQPIIMGHAVLFQDYLVLNQLPKGSILVADNLLPEQIIACQHLQGIILKKGGYLSHSAIIAREKNIAMIAQFPISNIKDQSILIIENSHQVNVLKNNILDWAFLDGMLHTSFIGHKAQRLAMMSQRGFHLPQTIILKHESVKKIHRWVTIKDIQNQADLESKAIDEALLALFNVISKIGTPIIVRSSTNVEDSSDYSYAGLFYSQAGIETCDDLTFHIHAAYQNVLDTSTVIGQYSHETEICLNLMLQPYIKAQCGGVLFTQSSIPGMMQVEISQDGAMGVTEGSAHITSLHINEEGQAFPVMGDKNILSTQQYQMLFHLGRDIQALFGKPQDIEWVIKDQQFYILQSRDISSTQCDPIFEQNKHSFVQINAISTEFSNA